MRAVIAILIYILTGVVLIAMAGFILIPIYVFLSFLVAMLS